LKFPKVVLQLPGWIESAAGPGRIYPAVEQRMELVIKLARMNIEHKTGGPFGAGIFESESGRLISVGVNLVESANCSVAHAEMVAIAIAQRMLGCYDLAGGKDAVIIGHDNLPADMQWLIDKQVDETAKHKSLDYNAATIRNLQALLPKVKASRLNTMRIQGEIKFFELNTQDIEEGFEIVKPTVTFPDKYTLELGDMQLEMVYFGKGHSMSDILIYIPQEGVLVTGAIVYLRGHLPGITERAELKDVRRYIAVLNSFLEEGLKVDRVITSHSPVLTRDDLKYVRDYYQAMLDGISAARREGLTLEQAKDRFAVRKKFPRFYQKQSAEWSKAKQDRNITVLWQRLQEAEEKSKNEKTIK